MIEGQTYTPLLATAPKAAASWSVVTDISWPSDMEYFESPDHSPTGRSSPAASPGISIPVCRPKPKRSRSACRPSRLTRLIAWIMPTLQECFIISSQFIFPCTPVHLIVVSATSIFPLQTKLSSSIEGCASIREAMAKTLSVEPGSKESTMRLFLRSSAEYRQ